VPIHGSLEEAGLPDVLQLLALGRKSGCLTVVDGEMRGEIFLTVGRVSFATVANRRDRLGDILVKSGRITKEQLSVATDEQARGNARPLGQILVDSGRISRGSLERFVRLQVEEAVYFLFAWRRGEFTFSSDRLPPHNALLVSLDAEGLLLEGARRVDEWGVIQKKVPSFDLVYRLARQRVGGAGAELTEEQKRILPLLDGTRDANGVVDVTGLSEFDVGKALYGLISAGMIKLVERRMRVRCLDYRELLAYVVREAEFTDAQRRKEAARHIVDCVKCAERLRGIHYRQSGSATAVTAAIAAPEQGLEHRPAAVSPAPLAVAAAAALPEYRNGERRRGERRTGRDRRCQDRRCGRDRRQAVIGSWTQSNAERRLAPRRAADQRGGAGRGRRSGDVDRRAAAAARQPIPGTRTTEARRIGQPEPGVRGGLSAAAVLDEGSAAETAVPTHQAQWGEDGADQETAETPAAEVEEPAAADQAPVEPVATSGAARGPTHSSQIEWIVSPRESLEMMRASQTRARQASGADRTARPAAAPAAPAPTPKPEPPLTQRLPVATRAAEVGRGRAASRRPLGIAAAIAAVGVLAFAAGRLGGGSGGGSEAVTEAAAAEVAAPPAVEPAAAPPSATEREPPRTVASAPTPPAARDAPPTQRPSAPAQVAAAAPPPRATPEVRAPPQPARQPVAPPAAAAAPAPATPPPAQRAEPQPAVAQPAPAAAPAPTAPAQATPPPAAAAPAPAAAAPPAAPAAAPSQPDRELAAGGWSPLDRAEAVSLLGGTLGVIEGLRVESIARSTTGSRPRIRVVQVAETGERITLTETLAGANVRSPGPARVTSVRVMPPSEAYPLSTGTVSFGSLLITVRSSLAADALQTLLGRLSDAGR
jgi:hypothetical protein